MPFTDVGAAYDLDFQTVHFRFSTRAAVIVLRSDERGREVLVCREPGLRPCYLPGGRIHAGEDSTQAAQREFLEETGQAVGPLNLVVVEEGFFAYGAAPHHVMAFYYVATAPPPLPSAAFANLSEAGHWFEWVGLEALEEAQLVPPALRDLLPNLSSEAGVRHLVSRRKLL